MSSFDSRFLTKSRKVNKGGGGTYESFMKASAGSSRGFLGGLAGKGSGPFGLCDRTTEALGRGTSPRYCTPRIGEIAFAVAGSDKIRTSLEDAIFLCGVDLIDGGGVDGFGGKGRRKRGSGRQELAAAILVVYVTITTSGRYQIENFSDIFRAPFGN